MMAASIFKYHIHNIQLFVINLNKLLANVLYLYHVVTTLDLILCKVLITTCINIKFDTMFKVTYLN